MWMETSINKCVTIYKRSFTLLEFIFAIALIGIISSFFIYKNIDNSLDVATKRLILYLKYTRQQALIDDKFDKDDPLWFRKRYSFRLRRCSGEGIYYTIHSDSNKNGYISKDETLKDPLSNKYIYSSNTCEKVSSNSKYVLLTKEFGIQKVDMSCNDTSSLGMIVFGSEGKIYSKFDATDAREFEITSTCTITLYDKSNNFKTIRIEANTGYIYLQK